MPAAIVSLVMRFAKIKFESRTACAQALHGLMQRGRVTVLRDQVFIVPEAALQWLASQNLPYTLLRTMNQDDVVQTLRGNPAHSV
jgi:hypothetical protein